MNVLDQRQMANGVSNGNFAAISALFRSLIDRNFQRTSVYGIALHELRKSAAMKDALADTPGTSLLGVADIAGSLLTGTQTNNTTASESASFLFPLPAAYMPGGAITVRIRAKVSAARFVSATVDCVAKVAGDTLGADICATNPQNLTTGYVNYDFTITPTSRVAGELINVDVYLITDDTGGSSNGTPTATHIEMRCDTSP